VTGGSVPAGSATFASTDQAPTAARRLIVSSLEIAGCEREAVDDVALLTSELVTNAVKHANAQPITIQLDYAGHRVRVSVIDGSHAHPLLGDLDPEREGGRGLALVAALSVEWGFRYLADGGKEVWFEIPCC
jgi:anti-sigma regulatory factor (Ser/Thr protein kinase)